VTMLLFADTKPTEALAVHKVERPGADEVRRRTILLWPAS